MAEAPFYIGLFARIMIFAIAAVSLDLILGYGGLVSFGHAAYLGIGAYAVGILSYYGITNGFVHFATAFFAAAIAALVIGFVSLRTSGVYFIMITWPSARWCISVGIGLNEYRRRRRAEHRAAQRFRRRARSRPPGRSLLLRFGLLLLFLFLGNRIVQSRFGMVLQGVKSNERRMIALGFPTFRYKLTAFVMAGAVCGIAGALFANLTLFVSPSIMHWTRSGEIMMMVILGGIGSLFGPVFGAAAYLVLESVLSRLTEHWQAVLGPMLILVVLFSKTGLSGSLRSRGGAVAEALLETAGLTKRFGGLVATGDVSLAVAPGEIHAVIGPERRRQDDAGRRSSAGELQPDAGTIRFAGADISRLGPARRAALGIARSFQITSIFREFTALDNVALAVQARAGHSFRFWRAARRDARLRDPALRCARRRRACRTRRRCWRRSLSHGEKRALELAMALATGPRLLLLDEPMAGMGPEESAAMVRLLAGLKGRFSIVLVEHDMDAVFALADRITVMVYGRVIATGTPAAIRADPEVRRAYLGEEGG